MDHWLDEGGGLAGGVEPVVGAFEDVLDGHGRYQETDHLGEDVDDLRTHQLDHPGRVPEEDPSY